MNKKKSYNGESPLVNSFWLVGEKVFSLSLVLIINILVARELGVEKFGILSYLLAILSILTPLSSLGLNALVTKELINQPELKNKIMSTGLLLRVMGALISLLIILIVLPIVENSAIKEFHWALILFAIVNIGNAFHIIDFWYQSQQLNRLIVICRAIIIVSFFCIKGYLVFISASFDYFIFAFALEFLFLSLIFLGLYLKDNNKFSFRKFDLSYGINLLRQSAWLIVSGFASIIYLKIDQIMLGEIISVNEVGLYAVASRLSEVWYIFATAFVTAFFPKILRAKKQSSLVYQKQLQLICDALFFMALSIAIVVSFIGPFIINLLYGEQYSGASHILVIHIWAGLFVFMRALLSKWLIAENLMKYSLITHGIGALFNVSLNLYLIPLHQGVGAAIATVISYTFASYFALFFSKKTWPMAIIMTQSMLFPMRPVFNSLKFSSR